MVPKGQLTTGALASLVPASLVLAGLAITVSGFGFNGSSRLPIPEMRPVAVQDGRSRVVYAARVEVTFADWQRCFNAGGCSFMPAFPLKSVPADYPVVGVNWFDLSDYLAWFNLQTGRTFRLPTLIEWHAMARDVRREAPPPRFSDPRLAWAASYGAEEGISAVLKPSRSFSVSPEGIFDLDGNVWEWTADCAADGFSGADQDRCPAYYLGGNHIAAVSVFVRDPATGGCSTGVPPANIGLRLVLDEPPVAN